MREIKFRGRNSQGEWHYGYLIPGNNVDYDIYMPDSKESHRVLKETVGQYTGVVDTKGVEIYDGDILCSLVCVDDLGTKVREYDMVGYSDRYKGFVVATREGYKMLYEYLKDADSYEVAGNFHDDPELLEED